jgi:hypothetical protein
MRTSNHNTINDPIQNFSSHPGVYVRFYAFTTVPVTTLSELAHSSMDTCVHRMFAITFLIVTIG